MPAQGIECLLELAERGAAREFVSVTSREIGNALRRSQQTASRQMVILERMGLIARRREGTGQSVMITTEGLDELRALYQTLCKVFEGYVIEGKVFTGVGEGAYYMSQEGYRRQFREKLGFDPYPGTLNLRVAPATSDGLSQRPGIRIESFSAGDRSFGGGRCFRIRIPPDVLGAIFLPDRTHYPQDVLEIVSPENLRERLGVSDGDVVRATVLP
jgi:riboflavin kinase